MRRGKYYFNKDTLRYERVERSLQRKLLRFLLYTGVIASVIIPVRFLADGVYNSRKFRILSERNAELTESYNLLNSKIAFAEGILSDIRVRDDHVYRSVFDLEPLASSVRKAGFGGSDEYSINLESRNNTLVTNTAIKLEQLSSKAKIQSASLDVLYKKAQKQKLFLNNIPSISPISPADHVWMTSSFGYRNDPFHKARRMHHGIDLAGQVGIKIYATGSGIVEEAGYNFYGYGNEVCIDHDFELKSIYAHLDEIYVSSGDTIKKGQLIGTLGDTGRSTGPHLHYEIRKENRAVNPMYYFYENLTAPEYNKITQLSN